MRYMVRSFTVIETEDDGPGTFASFHEAITEAISQCNREVESARYYISDIRSIKDDLIKQRNRWSTKSSKGILENTDKEL